MPSSRLPPAYRIHCFASKTAAVTTSEAVVVTSTALPITASRAANNGPEPKPPAAADRHRRGRSRRGTRGPSRSSGLDGGPVAAAEQLRRVGHRPCRDHNEHHRYQYEDEQVDRVAHVVGQEPV